jgi:hypothetical protein
VPAGDLNPHDPFRSADCPRFGSRRKGSEEELNIAVALLTRMACHESPEIPSVRITDGKPTPRYGPFRRKVARFRYVRPEQGNILRRCDAYRRFPAIRRRRNRASAGRLDLKLPKTDRLQALRQVKTDKNLKIIPVVALNLDLQPANLA